jgi:hypothetical protein
MKTITTTLLPLFAVVLVAVTGCQETVESPGSASPVSALPPDTLSDPQDHGAHAHPSEGPHHGDLVELGNEEYHAEVLHDEEHSSIEIYILDGSATKQIAIDTTELTVNISHDGQPEQFILTAKPDEGDEDGKSSRFVSDDKELAEHLDEDGASARLVVKINGKSYRGEIKHDHDGHDHGHDDHKGHDDDEGHN